MPYETCEGVVGHIRELGCVKYQLSLDGLRETLVDVYLGRRMDTYRDIRPFEKCAACPLHGWCRGCPAVTYGYTGDRYAPDPLCWQEPDMV